MHERRTAMNHLDDFKNTMGLYVVTLLGLAAIIAPEVIF